MVIGETIKRFHSTGFYHPDLNVENILIDDAQNVFLLDFDRWKSRGAKKRIGITNIERLKSSIRKTYGMSNEEKYYVCQIEKVNL